MKSVNLNGINSAQPSRLQQSEPVRPKDGEALALALGDNMSDQISVSNRAEDAGRLIARVGQMGDVRHERVDSLRQAIHSDQYTVSSSSIADAIIRDEGK
jgi:flagellar biosynthesis anti-sigma factor FlgM